MVVVVVPNLNYRFVLVLISIHSTFGQNNNPVGDFRWDEVEYPQLDDWGASCASDGDCMSGICATSCSSYDSNPFTSTSCMCPCTNGPCCCGCVTNGGQDERAAVTTCPEYTWSHGEGQEEPSLDNFSCNFTYARLSRQGVLEDEWVVPPGVEVTMDYAGPSETGTKHFGDMCETAEECVSGICGTGCDCPSELSEVCSCQAPCNFPAKCCGGCFVDQNPVEVPCPLPTTSASVSYTTFDGPTPWMPTTANDDDEASISHNLCLLYEYTMNGVQPPSSCNRFENSMPDPPLDENGMPAYTDEQLAEALCLDATTTTTTTAAATTPMMTTTTNSNTCLDPIASILTTLDCIEREDIRCALDGFSSNQEQYKKFHNGHPAKSLLDDSDTLYSGGLFAVMDVVYDLKHIINVGAYDMAQNITNHKNTIELRYIETITTTNGQEFNIPESPLDTYPFGQTFTFHEHAIVTVNNDCQIVVWDQYGDDQEQEQINAAAALLLKNEYIQCAFASTFGVIPEVCNVHNTTYSITNTIKSRGASSSTTTASEDSSVFSIKNTLAYSALFTDHNNISLSATSALQQNPIVGIVSSSNLYTTPNDEDGDSLFIYVSSEDISPIAEAAAGVVEPSYCADPVNAILQAIRCIELEDVSCSSAAYNTELFKKYHNDVNTNTVIDSSGTYWESAYRLINITYSANYIQLIQNNLISMRYMETVYTEYGYEFGMSYPNAYSYNRSTSYPFGQVFYQHEHAIIQVDGDCKMILWDQYGDDTEQSSVDDAVAIIFQNDFVQCSFDLLPDDVCNNLEEEEFIPENADAHDEGDADGEDHDGDDHDHENHDGEDDEDVDSSREIETSSGFIHLLFPQTMGVLLSAILLLVLV